MLAKFRVQNFRSIVDLTLDFSFGEKRAPNGYQKQDRMPFLESGEVRAVPCLALFGANAAGKSNAIRAMQVLARFIQEKKVDVRQMFDPNLIVTGGRSSTIFECEIAKGGHLYVYAIEYSGSGVLAERLYSDGKMLFEVRNGKCDFSGVDANKIYDQKRLENVYSVECRTADGCAIYPLFPVLGRDFSGLDATLSAAFLAFSSGIFVFFDDFGPHFLPVAIDMLSQKAGCTREEALRRVVEVVRKLDMDILSLDIIEHGSEQIAPQMQPYDVIRYENSSGKKYGISIHAEHRNDKGEQVVFRFLERESEGTKRLAVVAAVILYAIAAGCAVFFDEFDRGLHPLLVRELLSLFLKHSYNKTGAQLCFATHCTDILDDTVLRMSEVGIVDKNIKTGTLVRRLSDIKREGAEIRNVTDFRKQYLDGFYAGIPYPAL